MDASVLNLLLPCISSSSRSWTFHAPPPSASPARHLAGKLRHPPGSARLRCLRRCRSPKFQRRRPASSPCACAARQVPCFTRCHLLRFGQAKRSPAPLTSRPAAWAALSTAPPWPNSRFGLKANVSSSPAPWARSQFWPVSCFFPVLRICYLSRECSFAEKPLVFMHLITN